MTPQKQLFLHKPEEGVFGDCYRTSIAMMLDIPAAEVPHVHGFISDKEQVAMIRGWLAERGLGLITIPFDGDPPAVIDLMSALHPGQPFMLGGFSRTNCNHNVVVMDGEIFDPSLTDSGIVGRMDDGYTWVEFIVPLSPRRERLTTTGGGDPA